MKSKFLILVSLLAVTSLAVAQGGGGGQRGGQRGQGGFGRGGGSNFSGLLSRADVQGELKITDDQKTKLTEMRIIRGGGGGAGGGAGAGGGQRGQGGQGGQGGGAGAGGGQQQDPEAMRKAAEEREKNALAVLTADQNKRLKELFVQRNNNRAILNATIQADLGFSDAQKKQVTDLQAKQREAMTALMEKMRNQEIQREDMAGIMEKNNKTMDEELAKILTADQATKLKGMGGAPFKFDEGGI